MHTQQSELPKAGGPAHPARPPSDSAARVGRRRFLDHVAGGIVSLGGISVIISIVAILFVIVMEMLPLFGRATVTPLAPVPLASVASPLAAGTDEYRENAWTVTADGLSIHSVRDGRRLETKADLPLGGASVTSASPLHQGSIALGLSDGRAVRARITFTTSFPDGKRVIEPRFGVEPPLTLDPSKRPVRMIVQAATDQGPLLAAALGPREVSLLTLKKKKSLAGDGKVQEILRPLPLTLEADITAMAIDGRGDDLYLGLADGKLVRVDLREPETPKPAVPLTASSHPGSAVTALLLLNGERTLAVGDASGGVGTWQTLRSDEGGYFLTKVNQFDAHSAPVSAFAPSLRSKGFLSADTEGGLRLQYATTGSTLARLACSAPVKAAALTPKGDGIIAVDAGGRLSAWDLRNPHPEATLGSLFGKVWYEGYPEPEHVWQSSGGTDDFEPKFGLYPLIYGTLKGTFYALIIAVPLALLSALYVSQFMHPTLKQNIKPVIEVMAALPSVVLGFIAALWLAPRVEKEFVGIFVMPVVETLLILLSVAAWRMLPLRFRQRFKHGSEVALIVPVVLIGAALSLWIGSRLEASALGGDSQAWLLRVLGLAYDQRNSVVVGLAMGFAVIPIIFTIAEDSLSNVPPYLAAGSLALGATRWQTALKVVLPSASPGIFSAVMIGFGRAVGETMIVLMATGNTAVMNMNPFKGFRALSANIAVELPEADVGGTLFRVLFLAAFLLFLMTFAVNTAAEMVRLRLRKKFQSL
jgi:phosphate transport system permease protein